MRKKLAAQTRARDRSKEQLRMGNRKTQLYRFTNKQTGAVRYQSQIREGAQMPGTGKAGGKRMKIDPTSLRIANERRLKTATMPCPECGERVPKGARTCDTCGAIIPEQAAA